MAIHNHPSGYVSSSDAVFFLAFGRFKEEPDYKQFVRDGWKQPGWPNDKIRRYLRYKVRGLPCPPEMANDQHDSERIFGETKTLLSRHGLTERELRHALVDTAWMTYRFNQHMHKAELFLTEKLQTGTLSIEAEHVPWGAAGGTGKVETIAIARLCDGELVGLRSSNLFIKDKPQLGNWHHPRVKRADVERLAMVAAANLKITAKNKTPTSKTTTGTLTSRHVTGAEAVIWIICRQWLSYEEWEDRHKAHDPFWGVASGCEERSDEELEHYLENYKKEREVTASLDQLKTQLHSTIECRRMFEQEIQDKFAELCDALRSDKLKMTGRPVAGGINPQQEMPSNKFGIPNTFLVPQLNRMHVEELNNVYDDNDWVDLALLRSEVEELWPRQSETTLVETGSEPARITQNEIVAEYLKKFPAGESRETAEPHLRQTFPHEKTKNLREAITAGNNQIGRKRSRPKNLA